MADRDKREQTFFVRDRSQFAQVLQEWAVRWCVPFSILGIVGTLFCGVLSVQSLLSTNPWLPNATVILTTMAAGTHSVILFSLPRINDPYTAGYWLPRLVMPSLLIFYCLGFVMLDVVCRHWNHRPAARNVFLWAFSGYTAIACLLFIGFLL